MGAGKPLFAKLFLECKEVPFIGATVSYSVDQAAIAYIDIPPHQSINNIKPRTLVQICIRDFNNAAAGFPWILMFEGEVFGFSFNKSSDSRSFSISAIDKTSYWDNALSFFLNAQQSGSKGGEGIAVLAHDLLIAKGISGNKGVIPVAYSNTNFFRQLVTDTLNEGGDFLDAVVGMFEKFQDINDVYQLAEDRLRITDRIVLHSSGQLGKLVDEKNSLDWFEGLSNTISGMSTLRMTLNDLMSIIFHDYITVPFPAKVTTDIELSGLPLTTGKSSQPKTIGEFVFKPNLYMLAPPSCNVFFPDEYSSFTYSRNFFQEPTRLVYKPELPIAFTNGAAVAMTPVYEPPSLSHFMLKNPTDPDIGKGDIQVEVDQGVFADADPNEPTTQKKREAQFLTNEELIKGIWMASENVVPSSNQFRASLGTDGRNSLYQRVAQYLFYKKRFENRQFQITSHMKPSVVPGFPALILDDSSAEQNMVAYCSNVTHRIYATQGGFTNTTMSYARGVDEQDVSTANGTEPPIPPWFKEELFGKSVETTSGVKVNQYPPALSDFYSTLLGSKGSKAITSLYAKSPTVSQTTAILIAQYRIHKSKGTESVQAMINSITSRDYVLMTEAFKFIGAGTKSKDLDAPWLEFRGFRISGGVVSDLKAGEQGPPPPPPRDAKQIKIRRSIIDSYRKALRTARGFRG